jgi:hypothetical protein
MLRVWAPASDWEPKLTMRGMTEGGRSLIEIRYCICESK